MSRGARFDHRVTRASLRAIAVVVALATVATAQSSTSAQHREFLFRLRRLEAHWASASSAELRTKALASLSAAESAYFAGDAAKCAKALDDASHGLAAATTTWNWSDEFSARLSSQLLDRTEIRTTLAMRPVYATDHRKAVLQTWASMDGIPAPEICGGSHLNRTVWPWEVNIPLQGLSPGDHVLGIAVTDGDFFSPKRTFSFSIVERRDERLAALKTAIEAARQMGPRLELDSAEMLRGLLESLASGSTEAHDYPGARLLAEAEQVVAAAAKGERWYGPQRDGEFWLALPVGATSVRTRVFVPSGLSTEKPATLVIALHGRSFDEDTWFDGYGGGQSIEFARKRGWLLAAPHCDGNEDAAKLASITASLADVYPIDMSRVLLVGHSRGGGAALNAVAQAPDRFRAVATIGAALEPARASSLDKRPLFLAAGDHDFAREGVEAMHKALVASGAKNTTFKLYPNTEHWLCVTDALPDVFGWFDAQLRDDAGDSRAK